MLISDLIKTEIDLFKVLLDVPNFSKELLVKYVNQHFKSFLNDPDSNIRDLNRVIILGMLLRGFRIKAIKSNISEDELSYIYNNIFEPGYLPFEIFYTFHLLDCNKICIEDFNKVLLNYIKTLNNADKNMLSNILLIYTGVKINYNRLENSDEKNELDSIKQISLFITELDKNSDYVNILDTYISAGRVPKYII